MRISNLYKYAENHNIDIDYLPLRDTKALSIPGGIALNSNKLKTLSELTEYIAHELGHQATCSFYKVNSKFETRTRMEERATRWAVEQLIPSEDLINAFKKGYTEVWQLAEYFDMSEDFIRDVIRVHKAKGNI